MYKRQPLERHTTFWQIRHYGKMQRPEPKPKPYATEIARKGKWKLLAKNGAPVELFDLAADISEKDNLLKDNPKVAQELTKDLKAFLAAPRQEFGNIPN